MDKNTVVKKLKMIKPFSYLWKDQLLTLAQHSEDCQADVGAIVVAEGVEHHHCLVLLQGVMELMRKVVDDHGRERVTYKRIALGHTDGGAFLPAMVFRNTSVRVLEKAHYLRINSDDIDEMLGWSQLGRDKDPQLHHRMALVQDLGVFSHIPIERIRTVFQHMHPWDVQQGQTVIRQGDQGDRYYLIEQGRAEIWRTDPFTDEMAKVAELGPGEAFGEEALLQDGFRNATVTMLQPGRLLWLDKPHFNQLMRPGIVEQINSTKAREMLDAGAAKLLDCRYEMEYEEMRIPGAYLIPLPDLRAQTNRLNPDTSYIVYCRSGRRSQAAAYLLRERGIHAMSLIGGIRAWPYEVQNEGVALASAPD